LGFGSSGDFMEAFDTTSDDGFPRLKEKKQVAGVGLEVTTDSIPTLLNNIAINYSLIVQWFKRYSC